MLTDLSSLPSEHILEIRYKPMGALLDVRGHLADFIARNTDLSHWNISTNRIDFRTGAEPRASERAFISHANLGYAVRNPETQHYFADRASKFLHEAIKSKHFVLPPIIRFGVRVQALLPWEGSFQELLKQSAVTLGLDIQKLVPIAGELEDIGPVVIIRREGVIIKARCGPMQESQAKALLQDQDSLPPVGFYVDIDQHQSDTGPLAESEIVARVKTWNARNWAALADYEQQILKAASLA